ncbi:MAG: L-seryl-tRNA(Sec) selenium transferase, partial [Calditrichaeota bacterium]|nr:L-seryl-tRNA(Sec) selenium transferase [Calditrichota bacterium]
MENRAKLLSSLPSVDFVLRLPKAEELATRYSRELVTEAVREALSELREALKAGRVEGVGSANKEELAERVVQEAEERLQALFAPSLKRVINATGVILHTNLGRAPLPEVARQNLARVTDGYCNLEIDLPEGVRGERLSHVDALLCRLTGAEMSAVVNNNAAAVLLSLNTLAFGKEVIVSRGQLIEIGGSFRLPEVMQRSGAIMVEVGTTNKTRAADYEAAITENTGAILVAHTSNYRVLGFTEEAELEEVAEIAHRRGLPLI